MNDKYAKLTDYEVYMLKRALIESCGIVMLSGSSYTQTDKLVWQRLLDEIVDEDVCRFQCGGIVLSDVMTGECRNDGDVT